MASFILNGITKSGLKLMAKGIAGQTIAFTKLVIGDGYLPDGVSVSDIAGVVSPKAVIQISGLRHDESSVVVQGIFSNDEIADGFYYRELGLYATDPDNGEILYCYGNAGELAEWIPPIGGTDLVEKVIEIRTAIGSAENVTAQFASGNYATLDASGKIFMDQIPDMILNHIRDVFYPADCVASSAAISVYGEIPDTVCTVRFKSPSAYVKGDTLSVNGTAYALTMVNGKALPDNAWVSGAVVNLQLDPANKKAFFSAGGADLSFITAAAEHIQSGYISADSEGEPVAGTLSPPKIQRLEVTPTHGSFETVIGVANRHCGGAKFDFELDFEPDVLIFSFYINYSTSEDSYYANMTYVFSDIAYVTGGVSLGYGAIGMAACINGTVPSVGSATSPAAFSMPKTKQFSAIFGTPSQNVNTLYPGYIWAMKL